MALLQLTKLLQAICCCSNAYVSNTNAKLSLMKSIMRGDYETWGRALREAFEPAHKRLMLSGTPFRSDGNPIPFLQVSADGAYNIDFAYDYPTALRDGVIREITFAMRVV
jgi:hypothetical protein